MLYLVLGSFILLMLAVGLVTGLKTKTLHDFFLGDRSIGPWMSAFAYGTTYFSAVLFIGYAGKFGWSYGLPVLWIAAGNAILGGLLPWLILGPRTRYMTAQLGAMTMPEFLEARYGAKSLKIASTLIIFFFLIPYSAAAYSGLSYLFEGIFNIDYTYALIGMAALTAFYLVLGGYFAVALTDFIQGSIMIAGCILMIGYVLRAPAVGGAGGLVTKLGAVHPDLVRIFPSSWPQIGWLVLLTSLGAWGMPQMVQKFYAIKSQRTITRAAIVSTAFCLMVAGTAYLVGATSPLFGPVLVRENRAVLSAAPEYAEAVQNPAAARGLLGQAMKNDAGKVQTELKYNNTMIVPQILKKTLPTLLLMVVLVLVLSATMSTVSSLVLVSSSTIAIDLLRGAIMPRMKKETSMLISRLLCALFIALSVFVSLQKPRFLEALMSYSWGTIAGAFLGPYVLGLFWKRVTRAAVWCGMAAGVGLSLYSFFSANYGWFGGLVSLADAPMYGSLSMLASLAVVLVASLLTSAVRAEAVEKAFAGASASAAAKE